MVKDPSLHLNVVEALPIPALIAAGPAQVVTFVNSAFLSLIGYQIDEIPDIATWWTVAYPDPEYREHVQQLWADAIEEGTREGTHIPPVEAKIRCGDGEDRTFETHASLLGDGSGEDENLVVFVDVTERSKYVQQLQEAEVLRKRSQELEDSLSYNRALFETLPIGLALCRMDGTLVDVNQAYAEILGRTVEETLALSYWDITPRKYESQEAEQLESLNTTQHYGPYEKEYIHKDGHLVPVRLQGELLKMNGEDLIWSSAEDVSDRVRAEREVAESARLAQIASKAKTDLLANMSHELRTPLNAIIGFSTVLQSELFGPIDNQKYKAYITDILSSGDHLLSLINDILDVSAIEAGKVELIDEVVGTNELVSSVMRLVKPQAEAKGVSIESLLPDDIPSVLVDSRRMKQALINLLTNAVKFTEEPGKVTVLAKPCPNGGVDIVVEDTGIGMDAEEQDVALSRFGQVESGLSRRHEGTGLGLPLTVELIELHGGKMELVSQKGKGTAITVHLPPERVQDKEVL